MRAARPACDFRPRNDPAERFSIDACRSFETEKDLRRRLRYAGLHQVPCHVVQNSRGKLTAAFRRQDLDAARIAPLQVFVEGFKVLAK